MLIIEGPDGAGKTTLVKRLHEVIGWPVADRVVDKDTREMTNLVNWVNENLAQGFQPTIFDRHRLISDPIYRFILPHKKMDSEFYEITQLARWYKQFDAIDPMTVYCLPPLGNVIENLENDPDNDVVRSQIARIYYAYLVQATRHLAASPGWVWIYDYTNDEEEDLITYLEETIDFRTAQVRNYHD